MTSKRCQCATLFAMLLCMFPGSDAWGESSYWIRCSGAAESGPSRADVAQQECFLRKEFSVGGPVVSASLVVLGDLRGVDLWIDGRRIAELEPYDPLSPKDVTYLLTPGKHVIGLRLHSGDRKAGVFAQLRWRQADGKEYTIASDLSWQWHPKPGPDWSTPGIDLTDWLAVETDGLVDPRFLIPEADAVDLAVTENYEQWKLSLNADRDVDLRTFTVPAGFSLEKLRSAQPDEDSWVSMAIDARGRVIIAKEQAGLLRMTLGEHEVASVEVLNDTLKECRGLLFVGDDLYANANNSKGLFHFKATGQDTFAEPQLIFESTGGVGHGRNDLALGPDGMIYSIHGDSVDLPVDPHATTDFTSPLRDARKGSKTSEGHLLRIDPKTGHVTVLAAGLRNPFGIDFNPAGDVFTYDADAEYDMGAPWYRPTRVSHLVTGGDFGWRGVTQSWPPYYPDHPAMAVPNLDIGKGSPTAVKFGTRSNFPQRYREALFILDWTYGRVLAVHTLPRGSSYLMTAETFLQGRPLNVTDLDFGPDGSMYLITGGRKTQSALYRLTFTGAEEAEKGKPSQQVARNSREEQAFGLRKQLEQMLEKPIDIDEIWTHLGSDDPWIRRAAANAMEHSPYENWEQKAFSETEVPIAINALMTLALWKERELSAKIVERLNQLDWQSGSRSQRETAAYTYWLCIPQGVVGGQMREATITKIKQAFPDRESSVNRLLSELLVMLGATDVVDRLLELATTAPTQSQQMHYLFVLRSVKDGWSPNSRRAYFEMLSQMKDYVGGQGMNDFITKIRSDAVGMLSEEEQKSLQDLLPSAQERASPQETLAESQQKRAFVKRWTTEALLEALRQTGDSGDPRRGEALFAAVQCIHCHQVASKGRSIGPNLTGVGRRFGVRDLLDAIVVPSRVIPESYQAIQVVTVDGKVYVGQASLAGDYRSPLLRLATDASRPYDITEIEKSNIELQQPARTSWMPEGLLDTLTAAEVADLLAFLNAGG